MRSPSPATGIGTNLYNPGIFSSLPELHRPSGKRLTILGNIPPRNVLAKGSPAEVHAAARKLLAEVKGDNRLIASCAGVMLPEVTTENIQAFVHTLRAGS